MRAKYKLNSLVQFGNAQMGRITAIITRSEGHSYHVEGNDRSVMEDGEEVKIASEVEETSILAAFREVKSRASSGATKKSTKGSRKTKAKNDDVLAPEVTQ